VQRHWLGLVGVLGVILVGCDTTQETAKSTETAKPTSPSSVVTGTVTYLQRIALPPQVSVLVKLEDVSLQDVPAKLISEQRIEMAGKQVPIPFTLQYDPAKIDPKGTYNVSAQIVLGDQLLFTSDTAHRVITGGNPTNSVEIIVQAVPMTAPKSP